MGEPENAEAADTLFPVFDKEMAEILESFIVETREILEKLAQDLLALEKGAAGPELLNCIFRAVHTIKGTSSFLGLEQMTELAHSFEDVLNKLRRGELEVTPAKMDVLLASFDLMKELLARVENRDSGRIPLESILARLKDVAMSARMGGVPTPAVPPPASAPREGVPVAEARAASADIALQEEDGQAPSPGPAVQDPPPEPAVPAAPQDPPGQAHAPQAAQKSGGDSTIRVDVARLDSLMNLVGELVLGRNRLTQIATQVGQEYEDLPIARGLADTSAQIDFITTELQMAVMKTRMVPIAKVFNKIPRLIRDLCRETGKDIDLQLEGEETELDKSIIEELNDPLIHIIRNASDHGIETPAERLASGKPARGTVRVTAEHEGNHIVIAIRDDGHGMDPEKLKAKALERGLITETQAREMSVREAFNLIFAPGFSTAAKVTNISGRGVGMDVVRTNITRLKGIVEIESELGAGSTFIIKLPLTLAIIQALLVQAGGEIYCIPLNSVLEVVRVLAEEITTVHGREVVRLRNSVLPIARIASVMGAPAAATASEWLYVVVAGLAEQRLGVVVDSLLGQKEVVIKSLGSYLGTVMGIAGSTILGDGQVIMILDVGEMMKLCAAHQERYQTN
jgi:two-component system chemotaxis sensor kinase CheA